MLFFITGGSIAIPAPTALVQLNAVDTVGSCVAGWSNFTHPPSPGSGRELNFIPSGHSFLGVNCRRKSSFAGRGIASGRNFSEWCGCFCVILKSPFGLA